MTEIQCLIQNVIKNGINIQFCNKKELTEKNIISTETAYLRLVEKLTRARISLSLFAGRRGEENESKVKCTFMLSLNLYLRYMWSVVCGCKSPGVCIAVLKRTAAAKEK